MPTVVLADAPAGHPSLTELLAALHAELAAGEALSAMMRSPMPDLVYRLAGDFGFRYRAHQLGVGQGELRSRPLDYDGAG